MGLHARVASSIARTACVRFTGGVQPTCAGSLCSYTKYLLDERVVDPRTTPAAAVTFTSFELITRQLRTWASARSARLQDRATERASAPTPAPLFDGLDPDA